jgi:formate hydrogenlyase subunit 3/multisubunit Na+/H+ antiporter MnhD subunit
MRALCGAVIAAGSLIGLGLLSIGIGTRYSLNRPLESGGQMVWVRLRDLDSALLLNLVFLIVCTLVGLATAFVGLAYHHHRRYHEHLRAFPSSETTSARMPM